ncbi:ABC transporter permease [Coxiella burnetii]|uniref:ABC transporter permease n=1 Tax=Coxiella burnetii TaxID=777 RepID=UPI000163A20C|nr:ABC transporter permease [Coxiella burnetii]EDR35601.1 oligopeptide ABC transporter, permease protein [Coxiella burnetii Q321]
MQKEQGGIKVFAYLIRRILYAIPILIGVNLITFALFFLVNTPDSMARAHLGDRHVTQVAIDRWKKERGYDKPLFFNTKESGIKKITDTLFFTKSLGLFIFRFGRSDQGHDIGHDISQRMWPSLAIALPTLLVGLSVNITFALFLALFRATYFDVFGVVICVIIMSISSLFYVIMGQYIFGKVLRLVPLSGYQNGIDAIKFLILPILIGVFSGIGAGTRWYRTIFLEELHKDYVRTARAKGLSEFKVLYKHILKNSLIPILTGVVVIIPTLFLGSLILESFFGIPGLGSYTIDAIQQQDFDIVRAMVFLGTVLYIAGLILTDFSYTLVDPLVRLTKG